MNSNDDSNDHNCDGDEYVVQKWMDVFIHTAEKPNIERKREKNEKITRESVAVLNGDRQYDYNFFLIHDEHEKNIMMNFKSFV